MKTSESKQLLLASYRAVVMACLILLLAASAFVLRLQSAVELGGDEGFELVKAFLCNRGHHLYSEIWSDQPPLFTWILSALFAVTGNSVFFGRLLNLVFSLGLLCAIFDLVRRGSGPVAAWSAVVILATSPIYLTLSASVVQEIPAFTLGLLSVCSLSRGGDGRKSQWLVASAILFASALMIKFTATLILPAVLVQFRSMRGSASLRAIGLWGGLVVLAFLTLAVVLGFGSFAMLASPHLPSQPMAGVSKPGDFAFPASLFLRHWDVWLTALLGVWLAVSRKLWREAAFPATLLATVSLVHFVHRPWWSPYYLHHAIPLAWLAGIAVRELAGHVRSAFHNKRSLRLGTVGAAALLAVLGAQAIARVMSEARAIRSARGLSSDVMLARMSSYRNQTHWIYAQPVIYAFHAEIPVPPELAVLSLKRFWSGQMTWNDLLLTVQKYRPEQLLLLKTSMGPEWTRFLTSAYTVELDDGARVLYVAKALKQPASGVPVPGPEGASR